MKKTQQLLACLNFTVESEDLSFWYKQKVISMNYGCSTSGWKPWRCVRLNLVFSMRDICIKSNLNPLTKLTSSSTTTTKLMTTKTIPISTIIATSYAMKRGIPLIIWWKVNGNWDNNMIKISQWRESHCRTNTSIRRNKSKIAGPWQSGIPVGKLTIWVRSFEIEKL